MLDNLPTCDFDKKAAEKLPSWIECLLLPSLNEIKGEISRQHTNRLDWNQVGSLRNETKAEIEGTEKRNVV